MVWKEPYVTKVLRDLSCPATMVMCLDGTRTTHDSQVWVGGFGFGSTADQGVWWRLVQADFPGDGRVYKAFVLASVGKAETESALSMVPQSESGRCLLVQDSNSLWAEMVCPLGDCRGFAAIIENSKVSLLMVGPPTEEAWEEFSAYWRTRT
jgi:hypothetical protein